MKMVNNKVSWTNIALVVGLFAFLYITRTFDKITRIIPTYDIQGSPYFEILRWFYPLASLFISMVALSLFWLMKNRLHHEKWVEVVYLLVGLFIVFSYNIANLKVLQPLLTQYMFGSPVPLGILLQDTFWVNTYSHMAGNLAAAMGLLLLVFPGQMNTPAS
jgi:hypothetical protein